MDLVKLTESVSYIPNTTNIGVIKTNSGVILIDSGFDDDTGKKILKCLQKEGLSLKVIINTHSHADHFGGNSYLREKTGALVYAPEIEASMIQHPIFEPFYLFSGAYPISDLKNKFVMAKPSPVEYFIGKQEKHLTVCETDIKIIPLPGHALNQIGVEKDGVFFCADSVFSGSVLEKHKIPFCVDTVAQRNTLEFLRESSYNIYVPSHGEPVHNIVQTANIYTGLINDVEKYSLEILSERMTGTRYLKEICSRFDIDIRTVQQYHLMNTIALAYLGSMHSQGLIEYILEENTLYWRKK